MATALRRTTEHSLPTLSLVSDAPKSVSEEELTIMSQCVSAAARSKQLVRQSASADGLLAAVKERLALGKLSELLLEQTVPPA